MDKGGNERRMENLVQKMGMECIKLITGKISHDISPEEYYLKLMDFHNKYPLKGHEPPLVKDKYIHYKKYDIQPWNFKEAAEMYMQSKNKINITTLDFKMRSAGEREPGEEG